MNVGVVTRDSEQFEVNAYLAEVLSDQEFSVAGLKWIIEQTTSDNGVVLGRRVAAWLRNLTFVETNRRKGNTHMSYAPLRLDELSDAELAGALSWVAPLPQVAAIDGLGDALELVSRLLKLLICEMSRRLFTKQNSSSPAGSP